MWYIYMFSVIVSISAHFNQQVLLTRLTELDNEVSNHLNLGHPSQNAVCGRSRLESDSIAVQLCSIYSGDSSNCIVLPKKWNEQEPCGQQCANWRIMDQDKHHQCIISLGFFQGISMLSMLSYSSIWIWASDSPFLKAYYLLWYGLDIPMQISMSMDTPMWNYEWQKGEDLSCAISWHSANWKKTKKNKEQKL